MGKIVLLDELTINQIAAGEVIERPASVIKEMIENSIDAGATNITVEIRNGGISYIRITDNGKGIEKDDLDIAFERHATSKIRSAEDLSTVTSMGFRGEALASIAAIAKIELVSKTKEQEIGNRILVEAGNILEKEEAGCPNGTSITVENLFFNTPVRYKFLKKDYTESGYIEDVITRVALVNPNIAFKLINTGKTVIQTTGNGDMKSVIYSIYGKNIAEGVIEVQSTYEDVEIKGVVGKPEIARSNRSNQIFFVNQRYVKDKTLTSAAEKAFKGMLPIGKFGFVMVNIKMNPSKVDVNVHPAKLEVRFQEEGKIFKAIYHAVYDTLLKGELVQNTEQEKGELNKRQSLQDTIPMDVPKERSFGGLFHKNVKKQEVNREEKIEKEVIKTIEEKPQEIIKPTMEKLQEPINTQSILEQLKQMKENLQNEIQESEKQNEEIEKQKEEKESEVVLGKEPEEIIEKDAEEITNVVLEKKEKAEEKLEQVKETMEELQNNTQMVSEDFKEMYARTFGALPKEESKKDINYETKKEVDEFDLADGTNLSVFEEIEEYKKPVYQFIGIAFHTYIILEMDQEMYILDQHAAHERILYEKIKKNYYSDDGRNSQLLLLPDMITLTHKEMNIAKENMKMFQKVGFTLEEFGENTIKISGVPDICMNIETKELFLETLDEINTVARTAKQEIEERFIATVACKAAVKANMALSKEEVDELMQSLLVLPNPFTCPHGRPTAIKMTKYDIEKKFSRR